MNQIRGSVRMVLHELIDAEATELVGAARYERTESRINVGPGHPEHELAASVKVQPQVAGRHPQPCSPWRLTKTDNGTGGMLKLDDRPVSHVLMGSVRGHVFQWNDGTACLGRAEAL